MVKIEITGDTPLETLASLTAFGMHCLQNEDVYAAANRILEAEQRYPKGASASTPPPAPARTLLLARRRPLDRLRRSLARRLPLLRLPRRPPFLRTMLPPPRWRR